MTANRDSLLRPTTCRACGGPLDNDYVLMCMACIKAGEAIPEHGAGKGRIKLTIDDLREAVDDAAVRRGAHALFYRSLDDPGISWPHVDSEIWSILKAVFVDD